MTCHTTTIRCREALVPALLLAFLTVLRTPLSAQELELRFIRFSVSDGLSQSIVERIIQDRQGFLWMATEEGLNQYDGYRFKVLRNDPGNPNSLSYNQITTVYEDRSGYLWIGTFNGGLNRYDRHQQRFTHFRHDPADSTSLSSDIVRAVLEDRNGTLWIGTDRGLNEMVTDAVLGVRFLRYTSAGGRIRGLRNSSITALVEDSSGTLWIGTLGGLHRLVRAGGTAVFEAFMHDPRDPHSLSNDSVRVLLADHGGSLWIGTDNGLNRWDDGSRERWFHRFQSSPGRPGTLSSNRVGALLEDRDGELWVGTSGGLNRFNRKTETFTSYRNDPRNPSSLGYNEIRSLFEDRSGNLWIGTYGGGVNKIDRARKAFRWYRPDPYNRNSLSDGIVWGIYEDADRMLWVGTHRGGLNRIDRTRGVFTHYLQDPSNPHSLSSNTVRLILEDRGGLLWIGTHGGGICSFNRRTGRFTRYQHDPQDPRSLSHDDIRDLIQDRSGTLWISTQGGGLNRMIRSADGRVLGFEHFRHDPLDSLSIGSDYVRDIVEDRDGNMWIGTLGAGLEKFDRSAGRFFHHRSDTTDTTTLSSDYIFSMFEDREGRFWVGTWGGGLNLFDRSSGRCRRYTEHDGLPNNAVYGLLEDNAGNLWISTNNGITRFTPSTGRFRNYSVEDGLQSTEFNGRSYFKSPTGEMFFGGINGFNAFFPEEIRDNPHIPPVVITSFSKLQTETAFDVPLSDLKEIVLSHRDYVFSFEFAALDFTAPSRNQYAYRMEGLDPQWIPATAGRRTAHYTTLPPGTYVFRVKGSNNDGIWNEEGTSIRVVITPPFWQTWWFRVLLLAALAAVVYVLYRRRLRIVRLRAELRAAHDAQMSIMPQSDPQFPGLDISGICRPANEVGGDFFDVLPLQARGPDVALVLGDVSGKAMSAAMTAVLASGVLNAEIRRTGTPRLALTNANALLFDKTDKQTFVAALLAVVARRGRSLTLTNAGLNEPLLKRAATVKPLRSAGARQPLGLLGTTRYQQTTLRFVPGDTLVFFTDGVPEARNADGEFYGEERLQKLLALMDTNVLSAHDVKERILADIALFCQSTPPHDDMTVVVVKLI